MKTTKYIFMLSAALLGASCSDIIESSESVSFPEKEIILTATREGLQPGTRSSRQDDGSVWWNPAEEVSVFYGSGSNGGIKFVSMNTAVAETVELQGSIQMSGTTEDFWAVYPYSGDNSCDGSSIITVIPSEQTGVEDNFSNGVFPAVAKSDSRSLAFRNICGGVKFSVSRSDIKSVTIKGNHNEALAGKVKVTVGSDGTPIVQEVIDAKADVTIVAPEGGSFAPGKYYYITLLPAALDGGITMTFTTGTEKGELVSNQAQTVKRSIFGVLKNIDAKVPAWKSAVVEPKWVDLGLSVKWATFNVGATKPEEYGEYFAWGETEPKTDYSWATYKWCKGTYNTLTKYCPADRTDYWDGSGSPDSKAVLELEDDAAHVNWGGSWRMPTDEEWTELRENCTFTWTDNYNGTGVSGDIVTSNKPNYGDKSIFIPVAGCRTGANFNGVGTFGAYWSSSLQRPEFSYRLYFNSTRVGRSNYGRYFGSSVRAVFGEFVPVSSVSLDRTSFELKTEETYQLTAAISPSNATVKNVYWVSSDVSVATVDESGLVTAVAAGTATITANGSSGVWASCVVTVQGKSVEPEYVDLGLSVKWATFNVGATKPEVYGDYFSWGETEPKSNYGWAMYKWYNGSNKQYSKYCTQSSYWGGTGPMDNKAVLDPEDDAAHASWGGSWRMPTEAEWYELITNCTWTWTSDYNGTGVKGQIVSASNGNSIFLPAAGSMSAILSYAGTFGYYWASSLSTYESGLSWIVQFNSDEAVQNYYQRFYGMSVRPVYGEFIPVSSISLDKTSLELYLGKEVQLTATTSPSNATEQMIHWASSDDSVAYVNYNGVVTALAPGTATITAYGSSGVSATCLVTVKSDLSLPASVEAVDLGLPSGLKWATMNVGATKPEEYGAYFAWGETEPKEDYNWSTYKHCNGSFNTLTSYCTSDCVDYWDGSGSPDGKTEFEDYDYKDDAAYVNWGGKWRVPTDAEWMELIANCIWKWTSNYNGTRVAGSIVTSKRTGYTDRSIFLPAAGLRGGSINGNVGTDGSYWSSSLDTGYSNNAWGCFFNSADVNRYNFLNRFYGLSIRPVSE